MLDEKVIRKYSSWYWQPFKRYSSSKKEKTSQKFQFYTPQTQFSYLNLHSSMFLSSCLVLIDDEFIFCSWFNSDVCNCWAYHWGFKFCLDHWHKMCVKRPFRVRFKSSLGGNWSEFDLQQLWLSKAKL